MEIFSQIGCFQIFYRILEKMNIHLEKWTFLLNSVHLLDFLYQNIKLFWKNLILGNACSYSRETEIDMELGSRLFFVFLIKIKRRDILQENVIICIPYWGERRNMGVRGRQAWEREHGRGFHIRPTIYAGHSICHGLLKGVSDYSQVSKGESAILHGYFRGVRFKFIRKFLCRNIWNHVADGVSTYFWSEIGKMPPETPCFGLNDP